MARLLEELYRPMWNRRSLIEGIVSGGLASGGLLLEIDSLFRVILVAAGVLVFIDAIMVYGEDPHIATTVISVAASGALMFALNLYGFGLNYLAAMIVVAIFFYFFRFLGKQVL
jgi:hypothetical protein